MPFGGSKLSFGKASGGKKLTFGGSTPKASTGSTSTSKFGSGKTFGSKFGSKAGGSKFGAKPSTSASTSEGSEEKKTTSKTSFGSKTGGAKTSFGSKTGGTKFGSKASASSGNASGGGENGGGDNGDGAKKTFGSKTGGTKFGSKTGGTKFGSKTGGTKFGSKTGGTSKTSFGSKTGTSSSKFGSKSTDDKKTLTVKTGGDNKTTSSSSPSSSSSSSNFTAATSRIQDLTVQEILDMWTKDVEDHVTSFTEQALEVKKWDEQLINNGNKIMQLQESAARVQRDQSTLNRVLDSIKTNQRSLKDMIDELESVVGDNDQTLTKDELKREQAYIMAEGIDAQLTNMSTTLADNIKTLNKATTRHQDPDDPINQIVEILNLQVDSLQWVEQNSEELGAKLVAARDLLAQTTGGPSNQQQQYNSQYGHAGTGQAGGNRGFF